MGVYIKGMKKPIKCLDCPMLDYEDWCVLQEWTPDKDYTNYTWEDMRKNCPLVDVKEPHGRLGDLDYLYDKFWANGCTDSLVYMFIKEEPMVIEGKSND